MAARICNPPLCISSTCSRTVLSWRGIRKWCARLAKTRCLFFPNSPQPYKNPRSPIATSMYSYLLCSRHRPNRLKKHFDTLPHGGSRTIPLHEGQISNPLIVSHIWLYHPALEKGWLRSNMVMIFGVGTIFLFIFLFYLLHGWLLLLLLFMHGCCIDICQKTVGSISFKWRDFFVHAHSYIGLIANRIFFAPTATGNSFPVP